MAVKHGKKPAKTEIKIEVKEESLNGESEASSENGGKTEEEEKITKRIPSMEEKKILGEEELAIEWLKEEVRIEIYFDTFYSLVLQQIC